MKSILTACLALALASATAASSPAPSPAPQGPDDGPIDVQDAIRPAVRWLRSVQDPLTGSYGGGVEGTALVLSAFASCPDRYRASDGPFVRAGLSYLAGRQDDDGAIADEGASAEERLRQSRLSAQALMLLPHTSSTAALTKTVRFLGAREEDGGEEPTSGGEQTLPALRALLAARVDGVRWDGPRGAVIETADAILRLSDHAAATAPASSGPPPEIDALPGFDEVTRAQAEAARDRGAAFLAGLAQDGGFGMPGHPDAGLTAMALSALLTVPEPRPADMQATIDAGLAWLVSLQREDGSIHDGKLANYITSASIMALVRAGKPEHAPVIERAAAFLQGLQLDEGEGYSEGDVYYGGIGYGSTERPDLSNLQMALEALADSGLEAGDETYVKALRFLERSQNRSESNDVYISDGAIVVTSGDDGGAGYRPGDSKAGFVELADGTQVPRSYGSMTYALLKCFVFAGLDETDPRMAAAWEWCQANYTLDVNPGFDHLAAPDAAYQGLFYYFSTMAKALDAFGRETIVDEDGVEHAWRNELCGRIVAMQSKTDGSWINHNSPRWYEGNPLLATAYALLTLDAAMPTTE